MEGEKKIPLLSICIPTYNQPNSVRAFFESIVDQLTPNIEIIVRDDSTNTETKDIVDEFKKKIPIQYFHGKKEGVDIALLFLLFKAHGKYVWWFGDDVIAKGALIDISGLLTIHPDISFVCINSREKVSQEPTFHFNRSFFFKDKNDVLEQVADLLGFISMVIFKREKALSGINGARKFIGSAWVSLYVILHVLSQSNKSYFLQSPYVLSDSRDSSVPTWYDALRVFTINYFEVLHVFDGKFKGSSIRKALKKNFNRIWKGILVYRAKGYTHGLGGYSINTLDIMKYYWNFPQFWIALPFFLTPRSILRVLYKAFKLVKSASRFYSKK